MWTKAHRARHDARLKEVVSMQAVGQLARWLERADPPRSRRATPYAAVVRAIAWHLRVGGSWRALPCTFPAWRTVYGWFRKWLDLELPKHVCMRGFGHVGWRILYLNLGKSV